MALWLADVLPRSLWKQHGLSSKAGRENGNGFIEKVRLKMSLKR